MYRNTSPREHLVPIALLSGREQEREPEQAPVLERGPALEQERELALEPVLLFRW